MDLLVLIHVLAGAAWFGGHVYIEGLMASAERTGDAETVMTIGVRVARTNGRLLMTAGFITVISGIAIVLTSGWTFDMFFVAVGLILSVLSLIFAVTFLKPREDKLEELAAEYGLTAPNVMAELKRTAVFGRGMSVAVTIVIILMILKPGI